MKRVCALILLSSVFTLVFTLSLASARPAAALKPTAAEKRVIKLVNRERARKGLAPVKFNAALTRAARAHSRQMARRGILTHRSANRDTVARRVVRHGYRRAGFRSWCIGENIARARLGTLFATSDGTVCLWMGSKAHRQVILKAGMRHVGVGVAKSAGGMRYFTLDLGRRCR